MSDDKKEPETDVEVAAAAPSEAEAAEEAGGGGKPFIVYYNALSRVVMAAFLIAAGCFAIPDVFLKSPTANFKICGKIHFPRPIAYSMTHA